MSNFAQVLISRGEYPEPCTINHKPYYCPAGRDNPDWCRLGKTFVWTVVSGKAQKAEEQLRDNSQLLQIRMQNACNAVTEAQQQLQIAQRGIEQAEENLRLHRDYYRAGTTTMSSLLEAQLLYQQTLDRRTDAYADLQVKLLEYRQAIGQ